MLCNSLTKGCWGEEDFKKVDRCVIGGDSIVVLGKVIFAHRNPSYLTAVVTSVATFVASV